MKKQIIMTGALMALFALILGLTASCEKCESDKFTCPDCSKKTSLQKKSDSPAGSAEKSAAAIPERSDVDDSFKWRTADIFADDEAWEEAFTKLKAEIPELKRFKGKLGSSAKVLLDCFKYQDEISVVFEQAFGYAMVKKDTDTRKTESQARFNRISALAVEFGAAISYILPEILAIPEAKIRAFMQEEPGLVLYEHALDDIIRQREHVLSEKEEALIASAGNVFRGAQDTFSMLTNADLTFPKITDENGNEVETSNSLYYKYRGSRDRAVRQANEEAYHGTYIKYRNTIAALMRTNVYRDIFSAKTRGYESSLHSALDGANIPVDVYLNLIKTVNENLHVLHRYTKLRKKILGLDKLKGYDLYNSLFPDADMTVEFDEAKEMVRAGLAPLGEKYLKVLFEGMEGGWLDVYENVGKRSGAYSAGIYGVHPFVLLNYHDRLEDAFTLAHEMGHAMHSWHSQAVQPKTYADYTIFNAEIASTTNEALLINHLLKVITDKKQRAFLLDFYLDSIRNTFFRQTLFAEFELEIHKHAEAGKSLTADYLEKTYGDLVSKYYGPDLDVDQFKAVEWSRIPHFYRSFYVYTYATGYAAAASFSMRILEMGDPARDQYIEHFLSGGSSDYSTETLKKAGVDMTSPEPILALIQLFDSLLDELEKL